MRRNFGIVALVLVMAAGPCKAETTSPEVPQQSDAQKLEALEKACPAGVLTREECEAKRKALLAERGRTPAANDTGRPLPERAAPAGFTVTRDPQGPGRLLTGQFRANAGSS